jgi:NAD(P)-dependent dehydrogenase (short-subunit alcohol dehydrogenase family)
MRLKPIDEQVAVVMGASSGIGRATALRFAREGAKVVVSARGEEGLRTLVDELRAEGRTATAVPADVADFEQVEAVAEKTVEEYGRLDTWVHLAAIALYAPFEQTAPEEFERVIDVTLMGQVHGAMAALPHIKREGRGALVHVSSLEARRSLPFHSAYGAAKHAIDGFLESLRVELRREGWPIAVSHVMPGSINTPLFDKSRTKLGYKPMGVPPIYQPSTVADVIVYAAEKGPRELVSGGAAKAMLLSQRLSPRLMDALLMRTGFESQKTDEPKPEGAPDNLFGPIEGHDTVEGGFGDRAHPRSVHDWLETHPAARRSLLAGATLVPLALLRRRSRRTNRRLPE